MSQEHVQRTLYQTVYDQRVEAAGHDRETCPFRKNKIPLEGGDRLPRSHTEALA
jgi:hypothetical protein